MIATINCSECGHDKGHTLEHVGHDTCLQNAQIVTTLTT